jgi:hypothetical protein
MSQQGATAVWGCFNSQAGSNEGPNMISGRASVLVWAGSVMKLPASGSLENNVTGVEVSVSVNPWLGGWSVINGRFVREIWGWDPGMCS